MSGRPSAPEKRPGFFKQLRTLYTFTQKSFRWLPWMLAGIFLLSIGVGVAVGFLIPPVAWWSISSVVDHGPHARHPDLAS